MTKTCKSCKTTDLTAFGRNKRARDGLSYLCRICTNARDRTLYYAKYEYYSTRAQIKRALRKKKLREVVDEHLRTHPCVDCGEADVLVLDFDHVRGEKIGPVGELVRNAVPMSKLLVEMAKCEIRCANCHRRKTARQRGKAGWRTLSEYPDPAQGL